MQTTLSRKPSDELAHMIVTNTMDRGPFSEMFRNVFKFDKPEASETIPGV